MSKYIHGTSHEEQSRLAILNRLLNERCLKKIDLTGTERILDVGCGLGIFSRLLAQELSDGVVVGVEKEQAQIDAGSAIARDQQLKAEVDIRQGSAYRLPLAEDEWDSFNLCFIRFLLEHLDRPQDALVQVYRGLIPGGKIILVDDDHANFRITPETPAFENLWSAYCQVYEQLGNDPYIGRRLISLLRKVGFQQLRIDFVLFGATQDEKDFLHYANNLIGILEGASEEIREIYGSENDFAADMQQIREWAALPDATLWYAANWAEGIK